MVGDRAGPPTATPSSPSTSPGHAGPVATATVTAPAPPPPAHVTAPWAPSAPSALAEQLGKGKRVALAWVPSSDDVGGYRVHRNGTLVETAAPTSFADTADLQGWREYTVFAFAAAENVSPPLERRPRGLK